MNLFSTNGLPRKERLAALHDYVGRQVARRQYWPPDDEFSIEMGAFALADGVTVAKARYSPLASARTPELMADGRDNYLLVAHDADTELVVERGRPIDVKAGDLVLLSEAVASSTRLPRITLNVVSLSFKRLKARVPRIESRPYHYLPRATAGAALAAGYADLLFRDPIGAQAASAGTAAHLYDLAALTIGAAFACDTGFERSGIGSARLALVKKAIEKRLGDPGLGVGHIAKNQSVSPRYIQQLFEREGTTFSEFLRERRLDLAMRRLSEQADTDMTISAMAYDCGFNDLSHFNRSFRQRFGVTPSEARGAALLEMAR